jgi:hypothetical protein
MQIWNPKINIVSTASYSSCMAEEVFFTNICQFQHNLFLVEGWESKMYFSMLLVQRYV